MTIYILDNDPKKIAEYLDDRSLDKMIRDIAQVLCNVHHALTPCTFKHWQEHIPLKPKWPNSKLESALLDCKWTHWARECEANYLYLVELGIACNSEIALREGGWTETSRKYINIVNWARDNVPDLPTHTDFRKSNDVSTALPLFMPKKYFYNNRINSCTIILMYRDYYQAKLKYVCRGVCATRIKHCQKVQWTKRKKPEWLNL